MKTVIPKIQKNPQRKVRFMILRKKVLLMKNREKTNRIYLVTKKE